MCRLSIGWAAAAAHLCPLPCPQGRKPRTYPLQSDIYDRACWVCARRCLGDALLWALALARPLRVLGCAGSVRVSVGGRAVVYCAGQVFSGSHGEIRRSQPFLRMLRRRYLNPPQSFGGFNRGGPSLTVRGGLDLACRLWGLLAGPPPMYIMAPWAEAAAFSGCPMA